MSALHTLFAARVYEASLAEAKEFSVFNQALEEAVRMLASEDQAGRAWCRTQGYGGYTSYASLDDLPARVTVFADLKRKLDRHAAAFAKDLAFDLCPRGRLVMDRLWVNVLKPGFGHSGHIHPHSVISGTVYVVTPPGAAGLKLEDPRLPMMMAAPPRRADAPQDLATFVSLTPAPGTLFLWESWLRHEVPPNGAKAERVSISFNYAWR